MIYNGRHLLERQSRQRPDYAEQLRQMRSYGPGISLAGAIAVVLTASGFCATFTTRQLLKLERQRLHKALQRPGGRPIFGGGEARAEQQLMQIWEWREADAFWSAGTFDLSLWKGVGAASLGTRGPRLPPRGQRSGDLLQPDSRR